MTDHLVIGGYMSLNTQHERFESEVREHLDTLGTSELKRLYKLLIAESIFLDYFDCRPAYRGKTTHLDFRFLLKEDLSLNYFAVKICKDRLEFYFRKPAMELLDLKELKSKFDTLNLKQTDTVNEAMVLIDSEFTLSNVLSEIKRMPKYATTHYDNVDLTT